jgi:signal transduction histidine kinase
MDDPAPDPIPHTVLSAASHELRGPLGVVRGYLRLLEGQLAADAPARRNVEQAGAAATRMAELLDELSEYARWARGDTQLVRTPASLRAVVTSALAASFPPDVQTRLILTDGPDVTLPLDTARVARVVATLAATLLRTQDDAQTLRLSLGSPDPQRATLRIEVAGEASAPPREQPATVERAGAGLSIAIAARIVESHGGSVVELWDDEGWKGYHLVIS